MAVRTNPVPNWPSPELVARDSGYFSGDIPKRDIDPGNGCASCDSVAVPKVLAVHLLPEIFYAAGILAKKKRSQVFNCPDDTSGMPFQGCFSPTNESRLVRCDFDKDPVAHAGITDQWLDRGDFHGRDLLEWSLAGIDLSN